MTMIEIANGGATGRPTLPPTTASPTTFNPTKNPTTFNPTRNPTTLSPITGNPTTSSPTPCPTPVPVVNCTLIPTPAKANVAAFTTWVKLNIWDIVHAIDPSYMCFEL